MAASKRLRNEQTGMLFPLAPNFRIVKLGVSETQTWIDEMGTLRDLITECEEMYPKIGNWFDQKVVPGLKSGQRLGWVAYEGEHAIASAVLKLGNRSKFCHLRVHRDFQDEYLGQMFFSQMTLEARHHAKEIHFTLPESLWTGKSKFFESFGFVRVQKSQRQYRGGDTELLCSAPFATVWSAVLRELPALATKFSVGGYSLNNKILISIKPTYAGRILAGTKLCEVRKRFSRKWIGARAVLYSSSPQKALVGEATINAVVVSSPQEVWAKFGPSIGCSFAEYEAYVGSSAQVSAIELEDVVPYVEPISLAQISHLLQEDLRPPQTFCDLHLDERESGWGKAVSVASLLHGRFQCAQRILAIEG